MAFVYQQPRNLTKKDEPQEVGPGSYEHEVSKRAPAASKRKKLGPKNLEASLTNDLITGAFGSELNKRTPGPGAYESVNGTFE